MKQRPASDDDTHATRSWVGPTAAERTALLQRSRTVAIVGVSADPSRPSHGVAAYLDAASDYELYFVNPHAEEILGRPVVDTLADLPVVPDIVDVFRRHEHLPDVLEQTLAIGAPAIWLQLGLRHEDVARRAENAGLVVVMDRCL